MFRKRTLALSGSALALLAACAELPQQNVDAAKTALESARTGEAEEYAPEAWRLAENALDSAMTEVEAQNGKFALTRSYDTASELLEKARVQANAAAIEAAEERVQAKARAEATIADAEAAILEARTALESSPRGTGPEAALQATQAEVDAMNAALEDARAAFTGGRFVMAQARAASVADSARAIASDISKAHGEDEAEEGLNEVSRPPFPSMRRRPIGERSIQGTLTQRY